MAKDLSEMSFAELGQLFPILLSEHNPDWASLYAQEKEAIAAALGQGTVEAIHHIGSTAVPGLVAKPVVDLLVEVTDLAAAPPLTESALPCVRLLVSLSVIVTGFA